MRVADLFCGGGGSTCGLKQVPGLEVVLGIDFNADILDVYKANNKDHDALHMDVSDVDAVVREIQSRQVDVIAGSPPCQDFSLAGNQIQGERAQLTSTFADIVTRCQPAVCIMENVPQMLNSDAFAEFKRKMLDGGYHLAPVILNAANIGVPQKRKRAFVVATLGNLSLLRDFVNKVHQIGQTELCTPRQAVPGIAETFRFVPCPRSITPMVLSADTPVPTQLCNCAGSISEETYVAHPRDAGPIADAPRLKICELGALSGFPMDYVWPDKIGLSGKVIGNAVCPPVMRWVAETCMPMYTDARAEHEIPVCLEELSTRTRRMVFPSPFVHDPRVLTCKSNVSKAEATSGEHIVARRVTTSGDVVVLFVACVPQVFTLTPNTHIVVEGSDDVYCNRNCAKSVRQRALFLLQLSGEVPSPEALARAAESRQVKVMRTTPTLVLHYVYGTNKETDGLACIMTSGCIRKGWTLEVRERAVTNFINDDLYWYVPMNNKRKRFRSTSELERANLLATSEDME